MKKKILENFVPYNLLRFFTSLNFKNLSLKTINEAGQKNANCLSLGAKERFSCKKFPNILESSLLLDKYILSSLVFGPLAGNTKKRNFSCLHQNLFLWSGQKIRSFRGKSRSLWLMKDEFRFLKSFFLLIGASSEVGSAPFAARKMLSASVILPLLGFVGNGIIQVSKIT